MREYHLRQQNESSSSSSSSSSRAEGGDLLLSDERAIREQFKRQKQLAEQQAFERTKQYLAHDSKRASEMRSQTELQSALQLAYKSGDLQTKERLERRLAPEEKSGGVKHPWA